MLYVDVIVPLSLYGLFTYSVPSEMEDEIHEGSRVIVQFGSKKFYTALVYKLYEDNKKSEEVKGITTILEDYPIVKPIQLRFWDWIASYYICTLGDVFRAALPSALKIESETFVSLTADFYFDTEKLTNNEKKILGVLSVGKSYKLSEIEKLAGISNAIPVVKSLADRKIVQLNESLQDDYKPKTEVAVALAKEFSAKELNYHLDALGRAPKQQQLLLALLDMMQEQKILFRKDLLQRTNLTSNIVNELVKKGILITYEVEVDRIDYGRENIQAISKLNQAQEEAFKSIEISFKDKNVTLLHGVTGSGKTEIYIRLIKDAIDRGEQVLYLVPEIALTTQITERLKKIFGNKLAVFHSRFNDNERVETWNKLLLGSECQIVLGARSAIFLPFTKLGLVIVDEEHETSYKQQDPAPRYNGRDAAIVLAQMHGAKVLLGTATPSMETYYNALAGKYGLVSLLKRYSDIALPEIEIVNIKELRRKKQMKSILSPALTQHVKSALDNEKQAILFQNRRGFAPILSCQTCSWTPMCQHCDVSLTYHKSANVMVCHYCGATYRIPVECPNCETDTLSTLGFGTEKVEEEVKEIFPQAKVSRMDLDTTRGKKAYEKIISDFEANKSNILIGTQMVSKGLDFENVSIVGVLNADNLLNYPDFRAHEKAFQTLTQVSGRSGRKGKRGIVSLQTSQPNHPIIQFVKNNDYNSFYDLQIEERKLFRYPPFYRLIDITLRGKNEQLLNAASKYLGELLRQSFADRVLGPTQPPIARTHRLYIRKIVLKIEYSASVNDVRKSLKYAQEYMSNLPDFKSIIIHYDVDPL